MIKYRACTSAKDLIPRLTQAYKELHNALVSGLVPLGYWQVQIYEDAIEVKRGLSSTSEENRLFGQISKYCTKYNHCFVVICGGDIRSGLVTEVHRNLKEDNRKITAIWTPDKDLRF